MLISLCPAEIAEIAETNSCSFVQFVVVYHKIIVRIASRVRFHYPPTCSSVRGRNLWPWVVSSFTRSKYDSILSER